VENRDFRGKLEIAEKEETRIHTGWKTVIFVDFTMEVILPSL
jgi:hypothetical protein